MLGAPWGTPTNCCDWCASLKAPRSNPGAEKLHSTSPMATNSAAADWKSYCVYRCFWFHGMHGLLGPYRCNPVSPAVVSPTRATHRHPQPHNTTASCRCGWHTVGCILACWCTFGAPSCRCSGRMSTLEHWPDMVAPARSRESTVAPQKWQPLRPNSRAFHVIKAETNGVT